MNPIRFEDKNPEYQIVTESTSLKELFFSKLVKENITFREASKISGISIATLNYWKKPRAEVSVKLIPRVTNFLGFCPVEYPKHIGEYFKTVRTYSGLSVVHLSKVLKLSSPTIYEFERTGITNNQPALNKFFKFIDGNRRRNRNQSSKVNY